MKRKKAKGLMMELSRRIYLEHNGTLKGFGKTARFYNRNWRPNINLVGGYCKSWNSDIVVDIRNSVGM